LSAKEWKYFSVRDARDLIFLFCYCMYICNCESCALVCKRKHSWNEWDL
jgi:hypothetical protein